MKHFDSDAAFNDAIPHDYVVPESSGSFYAAGGGKRFMDLVLAILLLPVLVPVIAIVALMVRRDGGSAFFGHKRVGRDGKMFRCWKLRSMVVDAQEKLKEHLAENPEAAAEWERDQKLTDDPRITRLGQFIRKTSLDELPQIWNVLKGEMSLVGPRPIIEDELKRYGPFKPAYLAMRPGVTGLWQVSGRNDISYDERVQLDVEYTRKVGPLTDLSLMLRTALVVLMPTGR